MIRVAGGLQAFRKAYRLVGVISPYRILTLPQPVVRAGNAIAPEAARGDQ